MIHYDHGYSTPYMHCVVRDLLISGYLTACLFGVLRTVRGGEGVACPSVGRLDSRQVAPDRADAADMRRPFGRTDPRQTQGR